MAYVIAGLREQSLVRIRLLDKLDQAELCALARDIHQYLNQAAKRGRLYLAVDLQAARLTDERILIKLVECLSQVYRHWQNCYQLEFLLVVEASLLPVLRHLADIEGLPCHLFINCDALRTSIAIQLEARDKLITHAKGTGLLQDHPEGP